MNVTLAPGPRSGELRIPASKSQAHRLLICAALAPSPSVLRLDGLSNDLSATIACLRALGARIETEEGRVRIFPARPDSGPERALFCGESGSTLRFLLPVAGALGVRAVFRREGRLPERPLFPLDRELSRHGMSLREDGPSLFCEGRLRPGQYALPGNVSSQFFSGLLFALPLLEGESRLTAEGPLESAGYVDMTLDALRGAGVRVFQEGGSFCTHGPQTYAPPFDTAVEGDWSNAAFFLCMGALSPRGVLVRGLKPDSRQGDRAAAELLRRFGAELAVREDGVFARGGRLHGTDLDASQIPDLVPALAALAACSEGRTRITGAGRLRLKESDRLASTAALLRGLGADAQELPDGLVVEGSAHLTGGTASACGDHRIAMAAAVCACRCEHPVTVLEAEAVEKS